jgi:hypothetical protein
LNKDDVPQDAGILDRWNEICYAVDDDGRYVLAPSAGWDPANAANIQAWEAIAAEIEEALDRIGKGEASPLLFHMARNQMDVGLLARYMRLPRWRVRRHLKLRHYRGLGDDLRRRYASVFGIDPGQLDQVPDRVELPVSTGAIEKER